MSMARGTLDPVADYIRRLPRGRTDRGPNDADLLKRFVASRDENAFVGLLHRHARLVWDVCRRVHGNVHDAEDSFQATFFVLARQAGTIRSPGSLAGWLYRLAYRTAMHAKKNAHRRRLREEKAAVPAGQVASETGGLRELQAVLEEEVNRLAEKHRAPFLLCCLEGKSKSEAAAALGWKEGTVSSRLARARKLLQDRLTRRGITLSAVLTAAVRGAASAAVPTTLLNLTARAALPFARGRLPGIAGRAAAATLANGVLEAMLWQKVKVVIVILLAASFLGTGTSVVGYGAFASNPMAPKTEPKEDAGQNPGLAEKKPPRVDLYGEPLPQGAIARMGTIQFRHPPSNSRSKDFAESPPTGVAFSPDGQVIATRSWEWLRLWNANTGKFLFEIKNLDFDLSGNQVFSPDGRLVAATLAHLDPDKGAEAYVCLWDASTGKLCHRFPPKSGLGPYVRHILFSPDSKLLAVTREKGTIHLWSTDTGKEVAVLSSKSSKDRSVACIAFSPDGKTLVTLLHQPRKIWRWDIARGRVDKVVSLETLDANKETEEGRTGTYHSYVLSEDGRTLACQFFGDRVVHLLDTSTGKVRCRIRGQLTELVAQFTGMAFTPDGRFLALTEFAGYDERKTGVSLWDTETGKSKHRFEVPAERTSPLTFSPDGGRVTVGRYYIRLYDVASGKELLGKPAHEGPVNSLAFTPDGGTLISGGADGMIAIWDAATGRGRHFIEANRWKGAVTGVAPVPGGSTFVSCGLDGVIRLHDWRSGKELRRFDEKPLRGDGSRARGVYDHYQFKELMVSGDGKMVIGNAYTGPGEAPFHSWGLATGKLLRSFPRDGNADFSDLAADGKHFLGLKYLDRDHHDYAVEVREIAGGRRPFVMRETDCKPGHLPCSLLTAGGRLLIHTTTHNQHPGRYENPTIHLWEMATGKERLRIVSEEAGWCRYERIALSPDGRNLATARDDQTLQLWDLVTGKELLRHSGYTGSVEAMAFSPDGKFLATGHVDGVLVWDVSPPERKLSQVTRPGKELDSWWKDLAGADAAKAHTAIRSLVAVPEQTLGLFKDRLRPAAGNRGIAKLIAQLDDDKFAARKSASQELEALGPEAEPALRRALDQKPSLEKRRRIEDILDRASFLVRDPELLRGIRTIEVLEYIATGGAGATRVAAIDLLRQVAGGAPEARLTREAKAALRRF
jgi:RNA polymerase sigma factor (sigma-70 family)